MITQDVALVRHFVRLDGKALLAGIDALSERELAEHLVARAMASFGRRGYGLWLVSARSDRRPVGLCALRAAHTRDGSVELLSAALPPEVLREIVAPVARLGLACPGVRSVCLVVPAGGERLRDHLVQVGWSIVDGTRERVVELRGGHVSAP